jgi:hypothetical protein
MKIKEGDKVRLYSYPETHHNSHARVRGIFSNGDVWLCNVRMPFQGTISRIYPKEVFELMTRKESWEEEDYKFIKD